MSEIDTSAKQDLLLAKSKLKKLKELQVNCAQFPKNFEEQMNSRQQLQTENETLKQQLKDIEEKKVKQNFEYTEALKKFSEINLDLEEQQNNAEKLFYIIGGFKLTSLETIDSMEQVATLHYNDECFVQLKIGGVHYDLLQIQPMHPYFNDIRQMVQQRNDILGLFANLRKFFDIMMKLKEENSKQAQV